MAKVMPQVTSRHSRIQSAIPPRQAIRHHASLPRRVSAAYSMSAILRFEPYIQGCLDLCFEKFKQFAVQGRRVNMSDRTNALALDVVGELGYGQSWDI
jgi:hypothetical protein